jgi:hypothetical protein
MHKHPRFFQRITHNHLISLVYFTLGVGCGTQPLSQTPPTPQPPEPTVAMSSSAPVVVSSATTPSTSSQPATPAPPTVEQQCTSLRSLAHYPKHAPFSKETFTAIVCETPGVSLLKHYKKCSTENAESKTEDCTHPGITTLGFSKDGKEVAVLTTPELPYNDCHDLFGEIHHIDSLKVIRKEKMGEFNCMDDKSHPNSVDSFLKNLQKQEFAPAKNLAFGYGMSVGGIRSITHLALLQGPLLGSLVFIENPELNKEKPKLPNKLTIHFFPKDADRGKILGTIPVKPYKCVENGTCAKQFPSIREVVLSPNQQRILITLSIHDGTHGGSELVVRQSLPLPKGAISANK